MNIIEEAPTFLSSDLSRNSKAVFAAAEAGEVRITRRDGESLVLMTQAEAQSRDYLLQIAGDLVIAATAGGSFTDHLADRCPWMLALSPADREQCAADVLSAARASFSTRQAHLAVAELTSWRETATAIAAGLGAEPVEWMTPSIAIKRP